VYTIFTFDKHLTAIIKHACNHPAPISQRVDTLDSSQNPLAALDRREAKIEKQLVNENLPWDEFFHEFAALLTLTKVMFPSDIEHDSSPLHEHTRSTNSPLPMTRRPTCKRVLLGCRGSVAGSDREGETAR
jgi:hypothetical protein